MACGFLGCTGWIGGHYDAGQRPRDLQEQIVEAVAVHFDPQEAPGRIRLHSIRDPILLHA